MNKPSVGTSKISIKVTPGAARNEIVGCAEGVWRIKIAAAADKGKANKELIEFLSKRLGISKGSVTILKGQTSHSKLVAIEGVSSEEIARELAEG